MVHPTRAEARTHAYDQSPAPPPVSTISPPPSILPCRKHCASCLRARLLHGICPPPLRYRPVENRGQLCQLFDPRTGTVARTRPIRAGLPHRYLSPPAVSSCRGQRATARVVQSALRGQLAQSHARVCSDPGSPSGILPLFPSVSPPSNPPASSSPPLLPLIIAVSPHCFATVAVGARHSKKKKKKERRRGTYDEGGGNDDFSIDGESDDDYA